jgi:hypothetical protein
MIHKGAMQESPASIGIDASRLSQAVDLGRGRMQAGTMGDAEHQNLLDQAAMLLEYLAAHPAVQGHETIKARLDKVERDLEIHGHYSAQSGNTR